MYSYISNNTFLLGKKIINEVVLMYLALTNKNKIYTDIYIYMEYIKMSEV